MSLHDSHSACRNTAPTRPGWGYLAGGVSVAERRELRSEAPRCLWGMLTLCPSLGAAFTQERFQTDGMAARNSNTQKGGLFFRHSSPQPTASHGAHGIRSESPSPVPWNLSPTAEDWYTDFTDWHRFRGDEEISSACYHRPAGVESVKICGICVPQPAFATVMELQCARASAGRTWDTLSASG